MLGAADLIAPAGPLEPSLFPGDDKLALAARVTAYIASAYNDPRVDAVTDPDVQDAMAAPYALWRAYSAVFQRMVNEPNAVNLTEKGSHTYTDKQRDEMKAIRDGYLADFLALVPVAVGVTAVPPGTTSVPTYFRW